jgi:hypothetical protein
VKLELTPKQKDCLQELSRGPMLGVKNAYKGYRAPNSNVSLLIMHDLACYVPPALEGGVPSYAITAKGEEAVRR